MAADAISDYLAKGIEYHVLEANDGALIGVVGTRSDSHLFHLFVAEGEQRKGVGRALWEHARARCRARSSWRRKRGAIRSSRTPCRG